MTARTDFGHTAFLPETIHQRNKFLTRAGIRILPVRFRLHPAARLPRTSGAHAAMNFFGRHSR
jgi:hypothetical protein